MQDDGVGLNEVEVTPKNAMRTVGDHVVYYRFDPMLSTFLRIRCAACFYTPQVQELPPGLQGEGGGHGRGLVLRAGADP